jgi:hypothetical protein
MISRTTLLLAGALALNSLLQVANAGATYVNSPEDLSAGGGTALLSASSHLVVGENAYTETLQVPNAGQVFASLTDLLPTTQPFSDLQFQLWGGATALSPLTAAGDIISFDASGPMTLYADVFAQTGSTGIGLYNFEATFTTQCSSSVPLPAGAPLLLSMTFLLLLLAGPRGGRHRAINSREIETTD